MPKLQKTIARFIEGREPPKVSISDTVATAVMRMKELRSDCVVVTEGDALMGIFTERDFLNRVAGEGRELSSTRITEVMTASPETLSPDDSISWAINKMAVGGYRNIPIVDDEVLVAVLSVRDVSGLLFELVAEAADRDSVEINPWTDIGGG
jgi:CBS domain-containing protein